MRTPAEFLASRIEAGEMPSAVWLIGDPEQEIAGGALGHAVVSPSDEPATTETVYDLASLTKPLVTSLLTLILARQERIDLASPARRFLPAFDRQDKREITLAQLLTHTAGLRDWAPLYVHGSSIEEYLFQIGMMEPEERPGRRVIYSDLGYIAMGAFLEAVGTAPLEVLASDLAFAPLGSGACFRPGEAIAARVAATEASCNYERGKAGAVAERFTGWRTGVVRGEVHDQNAWAAGGVAGHAGLFGTARDVLVLARELTGVRSRLLAPGDLQWLREIQTGSLPLPRTLAWRVNRLPGGGTDPATAAGDSLRPGALGHNGFTGTSVWIEPGRERVYVLLTNRVHPEIREETDMNALRRGFHRLASAE